MSDDASKKTDQTSEDVPTSEGATAPDAVAVSEPEIPDATADDAVAERDAAEPGGEDDTGAPADAELSSASSGDEQDSVAPVTAESSSTSSDDVPAEADVAIRVVGEKEGRALNHKYRGKDYATNVLSFPTELPEGVNLPLLGDLVICAPVVAQEAQAQGKALNAHYAHLTVHGVLHLLGLDHDDEREAEAMERIERGILADLGLPDPY
jgi:probable rRNA maturation factor